MVDGKGWATGKVPPAELLGDKQTPNSLKQYIVEKGLPQGRLLDLTSWRVQRTVRQLAV